MRTLPLAVTALCLATFAPAVAAGGNVFDATFAKANRCFQRTYDKAHLKAHPRQTVSGIHLGYAPTNEDGTPNTASGFELSFMFQLKQSDDWFSGTASCKTAGDHFACALEGDGGLFNVTPKAGGLSLAVVNRGGTDAKANQINLEGANGFSGFGKPGGDDLVFVIPKVANSVCESGGY